MLVVLPHATFSLSEMLHLEFERKRPSSGFFLKKTPLCTLLEKPTLIPKMPWSVVSGAAGRPAWAIAKPEML
jgi:hypothetical protein